MEQKEELLELVRKNRIDYQYLFNKLFSLREMNLLAEQYGIPFSDIEKQENPYKRYKFLKILKRADPASFYDFILKACERESKMDGNDLITQLKKQGFEYNGKILVKDNHPIEDFAKIQSKIEQKLNDLNKNLGQEYTKINKIKIEYNSIRGLRVVLEGLIKEGLSRKSKKISSNFKRDLNEFVKEYKLETIKNRRTGAEILPASLYTHYSLLSEVESHYSDYSPELINYTYYLSTIVFWYLLQKIE